MTLINPRVSPWDGKLTIQAVDEQTRYFFQGFEAMKLGTSCGIG